MRSVRAWRALTYVICMCTYVGAASGPCWQPVPRARVCSCAACYVRRVAQHALLLACTPHTWQLGAAASRAAHPSTQNGGRGSLALTGGARVLLQGRCEEQPCIIRQGVCVSLQQPRTGRAGVVPRPRVCAEVRAAAWCCVGRQLRALPRPRVAAAAACCACRWSCMLQLSGALHLRVCAGSSPLGVATASLVCSRRGCCKHPCIHADCKRVHSCKPIASVTCAATQDGPPRRPLGRLHMATPHHAPRLPDACLKTLRHRAAAAAAAAPATAAPATATAAAGATAAVAACRSRPGLLPLRRLRLRGRQSPCVLRQRG